MLKKLIIAAATIFMTIVPVYAASHMVGEWVLSAEDSKVAFGSIKKGTIGESHHFSGLSGSVTADGMVVVDIDLSTVETWIEKRNERMVKWVFDAAHPTATLSAQLDPAELNAIEVGGTALINAKGTLNLNGNDISINADMFVARLGENKVMVTTDEMIMLSTAEAGIDDGISKLMELASLPSIARVSPVTLRLVFTRP